jgi:glycosyltransferase involved in cell wall biosynthesis
VEYTDSYLPHAAPLAAGEFGSRIKPLRLAVLCDYPEEDWPSMDLCAEMLLSHLPNRVAGYRFVPPFRHRFARLPWLGRGRIARNAERVMNRIWDYPRFLGRHYKDFDLFHVCDHSYAHLVHKVPKGQAGVFCHDLDTFRCLLDAKSEPRPRWFRKMASHILAGMQKASVVFFSTQAVRQQILSRSLVDPARLVHAPYGVSAEFKPKAKSSPVGDKALLKIDLPSHFLLHVGSCIKRKRIDVLLDVFATVRQRIPGLHLVQVGGHWAAEHLSQIERLGIEREVTQLRGLTRDQLATLYQSAAVVLQPSEAEGFGMPVIEALACGAPVVASDLPVIREVGDDAISYCAVADIDGWANSVAGVLIDPASAPPPARRAVQANRFSWQNHALIVADAYLRLFGVDPASS